MVSCRARRAKALPRLCPRPDTHHAGLVLEPGLTRFSVSARTRAPGGACLVRFLSISGPAVAKRGGVVSIRKVAYLTPLYFDEKSSLGGGERYPLNLGKGVALASGGECQVDLI